MVLPAYHSLWTSTPVGATGRRGWTGDRIADVIALGVVVLIGLGLLADGLSWLRRAHLHRQASGEGLMFFQVDLRLALGSGCCLLGAAGLVAMGWVVSGRVRAWTVVAAAVSTAAVVPSLGVAWWVESLGDRCYRGCG